MMTRSTGTQTRGGGGLRGVFLSGLTNRVKLRDSVVVEARLQDFWSVQFAVASTGPATVGDKNARRTFSFLLLFPLLNKHAD